MLIIEPFKKERVQPASYDLTLGRGFKTIKPNQIISCDKKVKYDRIDEDKIVVYPGKFILATTQEKLILPNQVVGELSGKSSWGRRGLKIENAGFIDPGFSGTITLEILNEGSAPIVIKAGQEICQIEFRELKRKAKNSYDGKYQHQEGTTGAKEG